MTHLMKVKFDFLGAPLTTWLRDSTTTLCVEQIRPFYSRSVLWVTIHARTKQTDRQRWRRK